MIKLTVGHSYKTECGRTFTVDAYEPAEGSVMSYRCSDEFWRDADGKAFSFLISQDPITQYDAEEEL